MLIRTLVFSACASCLFCSPANSQAEDLWVTPLARAKGEDYLFVVSLEAGEKEKKPPRRIRCSTSLPLYIEEMAKSAERVNGQLLMRVRVEVVEPKVGGEMAKDLKILLVCLLPAASKPHLVELKKWNEFSQPLPEERQLDPFDQDGHLIPAKP